MTKKFFPFLLCGTLTCSPLSLFADESTPTPPSRNTTTGKEFETKIQQALLELEYQVQAQVQVGTRPNGSRHFIDLIVTQSDRSILVSLKWQQSSGTAEQKVPYEMICLSEALKQSRGTHHGAYLILGGEGWTLKDFYLNGGLNRHLSLKKSVKILSSDEFLVLAKAKKL